MSMSCAPAADELVRTLYEFLRQSPEETVNFDDVEEYGDGLDPQSAGEHVVGELPWDLKALCFLAKKFALEAEEASDRYSDSVEIGDTAGAAIALASCEADKVRQDVVLRLLTISIKDYFRLWDKELMYVRKGFVVTWTTEEEVLAATIPDTTFGRGSRVDS